MRTCCFSYTTSRLWLTLWSADQTACGVISPGPLAWRLMASLEAGDKAGGDKRGKQSAAVYVAKAKGGFLGLNDRYIDFRVDDHKEPIPELARVLALRLPNIRNPRGSTSRPALINGATSGVICRPRAAGFIWGRVC